MPNIMPTARGAWIARCWPAWSIAQPGRTAINPISAAAIRKPVSPLYETIPAPISCAEAIVGSAVAAPRAASAPYVRTCAGLPI